MCCVNGTTASREVMVSVLLVGVGWCESNIIEWSRENVEIMVNKKTLQIARRHKIYLLNTKQSARELDVYID